MFLYSSESWVPEEYFKLLQSYKMLPKHPRYDHLKVDYDLGNFPSLSSVTHILNLLWKALLASLVGPYKCIKKKWMEFSEVWKDNGHLSTFEKPPEWKFYSFFPFHVTQSVIVIISVQGWQSGWWVVGSASNHQDSWDCGDLVNNFTYLASKLRESGVSRLASYPCQPASQQSPTRNIFSDSNQCFFFSASF